MFLFYRSRLAGHWTRSSNFFLVLFIRVSDWSLTPFLSICITYFEDFLFFTPRITLITRFMGKRQAQSSQVDDHSEPSEVKPKAELAKAHTTPSMRLRSHLTPSLPDSAEAWMGFACVHNIVSLLNDGVISMYSWLYKCSCTTSDSTTSRRPGCFSR
jgi:hypothetical protein